MNLKKLSLGLVALIGFGLTITLNTFATKKAVTLKYRYNLNTENGINIASNWTNVSEQATPSGCEGTAIPCLVEFENSEYTNLDAFLAANPTTEQMENSGKVASHKDLQ
jgi:hypothetical protein